jgi:hypothetical protein
MLHIEAVPMLCVKLSRQNRLTAGLQEALIKPYSIGPQDASAWRPSDRSEMSPVFWTS